MADRATVFVKGFVSWAKVLPKQLCKNYDGTGKEWSLDFTPDDTSFLKDFKLTDRLKDKGDDRKAFLHFRKPEFNADGKPNEPYRIYDADGEAWSPTTFLGNGTRVDVKVSIVDNGKGKKSGLYAQAIRVRDHVPYHTDEFAGMDGEDVGVQKSNMSSNAGKEFEELEDDVPF